VNRAAVLWLLGSVAGFAALVGVGVAGYVQVIQPSITVPAAVPVQVMQPGRLTAPYVASAAREWLFYYYDWSVLNYIERSKIAARSCSPEFRPALARFLSEQWEVIEAGQQTQGATITLGDPIAVGSQWSIPFEVVAEPWIGAIPGPQRRVTGTLWLSFAGVRPGASSLLQVDALHVTRDESASTAAAAPTVQGDS
jgi:hypothetical protein